MTGTSAEMVSHLAFFSADRRKWGHFQAAHVDIESPETFPQGLIWSDLVNRCNLCGFVVAVVVVFRVQGQPQPWQIWTTIDQSDIRGSEPHNHDPSGAASD